MKTPHLVRNILVYGLLLKIRHFSGESHILPQLWFRLMLISSNYHTTTLRLCLAMGARLPGWKGPNKAVYRLGSTDMSVARCDSPDRGSCWWCGGSSPAPWVPCPLPPHPSADTLLPAELNQWTPGFTQQLWPTHWQSLPRTNERNREPI